MTGRVQRFARNQAGRDLIVGDIHGHFTKLQQALDWVGFNPDVDRLFSVGDLVDRGPESEAATEWLAKPWFHAVRGNHEQMAIDFAAGRLRNPSMYVMNGGGWNLTNRPERSQEIGAAFSALPLAIEIETERGLIGVIHADCPLHTWDELRTRLNAQDMDADTDHLVQACVWSRSRIGAGFGDDVGGVRAVVVGHTPVERMTSLANVIYIDTGGWLGRQFTILDAATLSPAFKTLPEAA